jgi:UDP-N-acetylmuramate--alanine ligase
VITNIEEDHLDIYKDLAAIQDAFVEYANRVPFFGVSILCLDAPHVQEIIGRVDRRVRTYGTTRQAEIRAENVRQEGLTCLFDVVADKERLGELAVQAPGLHNVRNALAAVTVGLELDIPFEKIRAGLARFTGVERRFQLLGEAGDVLVVTDYAHHPTEVAATLEAASAGWPGRRLVAVFQPHLYSRTRDCQDGFARAFFNADVLILTDVYGAREEPIQGIDGRLVADLARRYGHRDVQYVPDMEDLPGHVAGMARPGDVIVTMGAGNIWRYARRLMDTLQAA